MEKRQYILHAQLGISHWWNWATKNFFLKLIKRYIPSGKRILDAGCGTGDLLLMLSQNGYDVFGVDISKDALDICSNKGLKDKVDQQDLNSLDDKIGRYDGIIALDVIYHQWVLDDVAVLRQFGDHLRDGGLLLLQVPAHPWMMSSHDKAALSRRRYKKEELRKKLNIADFDILCLGYRVFLLFPFAILFRKIFKKNRSDFGPVRPWINRILIFLMAIENSFSIKGNLPTGLSLFAVCRKRSVIKDII